MELAEEEEVAHPIIELGIQKLQDYFDYAKEIPAYVGCDMGTGNLHGFLAGYGHRWGMGQHSATCVF